MYVTRTHKLHKNKTVGFESPGGSVNLQQLKEEADADGGKFYVYIYTHIYIHSHMDMLLYMHVYFM